MREQIGDLGRAVPSELGIGYRIPEGLRGRSLGKNDVLMDDGHRLEDGDLIKAFRACNISSLSI